MAEEKIYILEIDTANSDKRLKEVADELTNNAERIRELQKEQKANGKLTADQVTELARLRQANRALGVEQKNLINLTKQNANGNRELDNSTNGLRARLNLATAAYDKLTEEQQKNTEQGKALKAQIDQLQASVKRTEEGTGRFQRSVGNYAGSIREALAGTKAFGGAMGAFNKVVSMNPIMLAVTALSALVGVFQKAQPVVDAVAEGMSALNAVMDVLVQRAGMLINSLSALLRGDLRTATQQAKLAFDGLGESVREAANAGLDFARTMKGVDDTLAQIEVTEARYGARIAQLNRQLVDRTRSDKERVEIAREIQRLEAETFEARRRQLQIAERASRDELERLLRLKGERNLDKLTIEELIKLAQDQQIQDSKWQALQKANIALSNAQAQSVALIERAQTRLNQVEEQAAERRERNAKAQADRLAKEAAAIEQAAKMRRELAQAELNENQKAIQQAFKDEEAARREQLAQDLVLVAGNAEQEKILRQAAADEIAAIRAASLQRQIDELTDYADTVEGIDEMIFEKQRELSALLRDERRRDFEQEYQRKKELADKELADAKRRAEIQQQAFLLASQNIGQVVADTIENFEGTFDEFLAKLGKSILISTLDTIEKSLLASQIAAIAQTSIQEIATKGPAGLLTAALNIALIKGAFAAGKRGLNEILGFADGGVIPSGYELPYSNSKGDNVPILAKAGETIVNERQRARIEAMAGADVFHRAGVPGTRPSGAFADGGIVSPQVNSQMAILDAINSLNLQVSVTEINRVQRSVAVRDQNRRW